ncbi:MAG TPA: hypothetical protein VF648_08755 [Pyrinomonadaceae bacterium]
MHFEQFTGSCSSWFPSKYHERFAANLKKCPHRWLLTYDDSPFVRELFSFANIVSWNLMYGMRNVTENSKLLGSEL